MAVTIIAKNVTLSNIDIVDMGFTLSASGTPNSIRTLTDYFELFEIVSSDSLVTEVAAGNIIINNGTEDLSISEGLNHILIQTEYEDLEQDESGAGVYVLDDGVTVSGGPFDTLNFINCDIDLNTPSGCWYDSNWLYRKKITIDHTKVSEDQTNFPVLISHFSGNLASHATSGGIDILFTSDDCTKLNHEIEYYSSGLLYAWVKIPTLSSNTDTILYMFYGNPSASDQQNITGVWESNFKGVWHLSEDTDETNTDSTSNSNDGTPKVSPAAETGKIAGALDFEVDDQARVEIGTASSLDLSLYDDWAISLWVKPSSNYEDNDYPCIYTYGDWGLAINFAVAEGPDNGLIQVWQNDHNAVYSDTILSIGEWNHVVVVRDSDTGTIDIYLNGVIDGSDTAVSINQDNSGSYIGGYPAYNNGGVNGLIDEVRVSNTIPPSGWIQTEYNNQNSPGTFYSISNEITEDNLNEQTLDIDCCSSSDTTIGYNSSDGTSSTSSNTPTQKVRLSKVGLPSGIYHIEWSAEYTRTDGKAEFWARVQINDTTTIAEMNDKDVSTNKWRTTSGIYENVLLGDIDIDLDFWDDASKGVSIRRARISIESRV